MVATIAISLVAFLSIAVSEFLFPKIKISKISFSTYWVIALVGAAIILAFSFAPIDEVFNQLTADSKINPIKILILFFSMTMISILLDEFGLFRFLASLTVKIAKGSQFALFFALYGLVALLTVFTSNDVVVLTLTPFICFFCKRTHINPIPYLIAEFTAANTWSLMFVIGNPTNIFLATTAGIGFIDYLRVMALPTLGAGAVELLLLFLIFRKKLKEPIASADSEEVMIENKAMLIVGVVDLLVCLVFLIIGGYINIEMWLVSLICASFLFAFTTVYSLITKRDREYPAHALKTLPYPLIPFFLSMFVIVVAINYQGIAAEITKFFGTENTIWVYGYSSFLVSNLMNNIPMSILYSQLCSSLSGASYQAAVYSSIIGSNIGAFLTPMGALAGIMFTGLLNEHGVKFSFLDFIKYGALISIPTITVALALLFVVL